MGKPILNPEPHTQLHQLIQLQITQVHSVDLWPLTETNAHVLPLVLFVGYVLLLLNLEHVTAETLLLAVEI
jgi:hypothetical protein